MAFQYDTVLKLKLYGVRRILLNCVVRTVYVSKAVASIRLYGFRRAYCRRRETECLHTTLRSGVVRAVLKHRAYSARRETRCPLYDAMFCRRAYNARLVTRWRSRLLVVLTVHVGKPDLVYMTLQIYFPS